MSIRIDGTNTTANPGITGADADTGLQFGTDEISFVTGGTNRATVESNGNFTIESGNLVLASGNGIDFSATADGSGTVTSELLDEYEEGTFTPVYWAATGGDITQTTLNTGNYTKIGNICWIDLRIATTEATAFTGYSGQLRIEDLPFASATGQRVGALAIGEMWRWEATATGEFARARVNSGGLTSINLVINDEVAGSETVLNVVDLDLGTNRNILNVSGWYLTA